MTDRFGERLGVHNLLDVQLIANQCARPFGQFVECGAASYPQRRQRLLRAHAGAFACGVAETGDHPRQLHQPFELGIARGSVHLGKLGVVDAVWRGRIGTAYQVLVDLFRQERQKRRHERRQRDQCIVQRGHSRRIGGVARRPEASATTADIPVAQVVEEAFDGTRCIHRIKVIQAVAHCVDERVEP